MFHRRSNSSRTHILGQSAAYLAALLVFTMAAVLSAQDVPPATAPDTPVPDTAVKVGAGGTFNIQARDTDLRMILQLLSAQSKRNIVATREIGGKVTADLYGVTFKEALDAVLRASSYVYEEKGNFIYVYTPEQLEKIRKAERKMGVQTFKLTYVTATDARTLVSPALSAEGSIAITPASGTGITPSKTDAGGNSYGAEDVIVVRDYEDNLKRITQIIHELDVRPDQVLIEATVLRVTLNESTALGIDFNTLAGIDFQSVHATSDGLEDLQKGELGEDEIKSKASAAAIRTDFTSAIEGAGLNFGFISNHFAFFIKALETVTPTTVLANPKLLVINKQRGEVLVGNRDGYLTTTITETVATQTVQFLETGTKLIVRPYIGRDGYVRLEIHPEDSSGSVAQVGNAVLPSQTTTEVTSNVLVKDGHTIVIGGLFRERTTTGRAQVPVAGNLPIVGALFRRTADATVREEVIILVTPRIIKQAADEGTSDQLKEQVERYRIGARKGLQWFGRDRLAQCHMRAAKKDLANGKIDNALWNIDLALNMTPQMTEAIQFKERLTGKAYWSDESRVSDAQYIVQQMIMQELGKPLEDIVPPRRPLNPMLIDPEVRETMGIQPRIHVPLPLLIDPSGKLEVKVTTMPADGESRANPATAPAE